TAATATSRSIRCAASTATPRSSRSEKAPMRCSRWSSLALSALSALAVAAPARAANLAIADGGLSLMAGDGGARTRVMPRGAAGFSDPSWAPDAKRLVALRTTNLGSEHEASALYIVSLDGGRAAPLRGGENLISPDWSPDGTRIAYASDRGSTDAGPEVFAMDADGGCPTQLTWGSGSAGSPVWQPGSGAAERGPCGQPARSYFLDLDLAALRLRDAVPLYLGPRFGRRYLSDISAPTAF